MPNFLTLKTLKTFIISFIRLTDGGGTSNFGVDFTQLWNGGICYFFAKKKKLSFGNKNNKMALFSHFLAKDVNVQCRFLFQI
jgi:hypothetical protein